MFQTQKSKLKYINTIYLQCDIFEINLNTHLDIKNPTQGSW